MLAPFCITFFPQTSEAYGVLAVFVSDWEALAADFCRRSRKFKSSLSLAFVPVVAGPGLGSRLRTSFVALALSLVVPGLSLLSVTLGLLCCCLKIAQEN